MYSVITQAEVQVSQADGFSLRSGLSGVWRLHMEGFTLEGFSGGRQWCLVVHRLIDLGQRPYYWLSCSSFCKFLLCRSIGVRCLQDCKLVYWEYFVEWLGIFGGLFSLSSVVFFCEFGRFSKNGAAKVSEDRKSDLYR